MGGKYKTNKKKAVMLPFCARLKCVGSVRPGTKRTQKVFTSFPSSFYQFQDFDESNFCFGIPCLVIEVIKHVKRVYWGKIKTHHGFLSKCPKRLNVFPVITGG
jgi:hypothetical protein